MAAADDFDVEDLLEEAFNKTTTPVDSEEVGTMGRYEVMNAVTGWLYII